MTALAGPEIVWTSATAKRVFDGYQDMLVRCAEMRLQALKHDSPSWSAYFQSAIDEIEATAKREMQGLISAFTTPVFTVAPPPA